MLRPSAAFFPTPTEALGDALPDRLQRLVAGAMESGVDADAFRRAVVDRDEHAIWPWRRRMEIEMTVLIASTSAPQKGRRRPVASRVFRTFAHATTAP